MPNTISHVRRIAVATLVLAAPLAAQSTDSIERRAQQARSGAGLRAGTWDARGFPTAPANARLSDSPAFEGYFQKGLDLHLTLENTLGVYWRDSERTETSSGGLLGGPSTSTEKSRSYVIPLFTSLKAYPVTRPGALIQPYVLGGAGVALGIEDREASGTFGNGGMAFAQGLGVKGGAGVEVRLSQAFGLAVGGHWQWIRFLNDFSGTDELQGAGANVGITYRFQYR